MVGDRTHRLTYQRPSPTSPGSYLPVWPDVWGELMPGNPGGEVLANGGSSAPMAWRIETNYREDVRAEWRIVEPSTGRVFEIRGYADPDDNAQDLILFCVEVQ